MRKALTLVALTVALASPEARSAPAATVDHSTFDALLRKHVVDGMVDYGGFEGADFKAYLASLDTTSPATLDPGERLAYWINVYNAYTIELIVSHHEQGSIRDINRTLGVALKGPWREKLVKAGGKIYNLDNVEHDIIRKQWKEPRIHFALVCAAMGCPPLRSEAYTGAKLEEQLAGQASLFLVGSPAKNRVDVKAGIVYGSMIYVKYYREDFGGTDAAIGGYLAGYYAEGPEKQLLLSGKFKLVETPYDWTLNSQAKARELAAKKP